MPYHQTWTKKPGEVNTIPFEFSGKFPVALTLVSATVTATEMPSGIDRSSGPDAVIGTTLGAVSGTQVSVLVKNGVAGRRYLVQVVATLSDGTSTVPAEVLVIITSRSARNP